MLELLYLYRGFLGNRRDVSRKGGEERRGEVVVVAWSWITRVVVIFREDIGYVWMWMGILGEGGWGWDRERVDRLFSFFLRKKGFSCGGGN